MTASPIAVDRMGLHLPAVHVVLAVQKHPTIDPAGQTNRSRWLEIIGQIDRESQTIVARKDHRATTDVRPLPLVGGPRRWLAASGDSRKTIDLNLVVVRRPEAMMAAPVSRETIFDAV